jgi:hypothetical protein
MITLSIIVLLALCGTHYMAYVLGEDASTARWMKRMRELQGRLEKFMEDSLVVKSKVKKPRKVAIKKK